MGADSTSQAIKRIPNALSALRIPLSLSLLLTRPFSTSFFALYVACGLTDALDGFFARKLHAESALGAKLDSIADFTFFTVVLYVFLTVLSIPPLIVAWALAIALIRLGGLVVAAVKFRSWAALHTHAFRGVGFVFFCFPLFCLVFGTLAAGIALNALGTLATAEELYINAHANSLDPDIRSARQLPSA